MSMHVIAFTGAGFFYAGTRGVNRFPGSCPLPAASPGAHPDLADVTSVAQWYGGAPGPKRIESGLRG